MRSFATKVTKVLATKDTKSTKERSSFFVLLLVLSAAMPVHAQRPSDPAPRLAPRVDPLTASIQGRVTAADSGAPLRRAEVRAIAVPGGVMRLATTNGDGQFELRDLPAGEWRLHVSRSGFVPLDYGQRRPFEASTPVTLKEGERATVAMSLPRAAAITGRILDDAGEPLAGARLQALRSRTVEGQRRLLPVGAVDISDDTGAFRLHGLPPGEYYVVAMPPETPLPSLPRGALPGQMPPGANMRLRRSTFAFYPGTTSQQEAVRLTVGVGGETRADMQLGTLRGAAVSGTVIDSAGAPVPDASISIRSNVVGVGAPAMVSPFVFNGHAAADGTFEVTDVPPGEYSLQVSAPPMMTGRVQTTPDGPPMIVMEGEFGALPIVVPDTGVSGLTVTTSGPTSIQGTFVADSGVTRPLPTGLEVTSRSTSSGGAHMMTMRNAPDRSFGLMVGGPSSLQVNGLPDDWAVKAIVVDGRDVTDEPVHVNGGRADVRVVLTDRLTEVTGTVSAPASTDRTDDARHASVVVFPADATKWTYPSRYLRTVRATEQGAFRIAGLPPNERYLALAVDYLEDGEGSDPEFLEAMEGRATSFTLGDVERKSLTLPLIER